MTGDLEALARRHGIVTRWTDMEGHPVTVPERTLRGLLSAFGVEPEAASASVAAATPVGAAPADRGGARQDADDTPPPGGVAEAAEATAVDPAGAVPPAPAGVRCFVPAWLKKTRAWGVALQLYQLRSARNLGIGDFADLAWVARRTAALGADFVGVNPLHALFMADPERASPFAPSNRRFLNPLYIALDDVPGHDPLDVDEASRRAVRSTDAVDYAAVAALKRAALARAWARFRAGAVENADERIARFAAFRRERGRPLEVHALFETLSEKMVADGHGAGWSTWPHRWRDHASETVANFRALHEEAVSFHAWLQWLAHEQLAGVQEAAREAGMRIGLYLDVAVGAAPDGSATWSDPALTLPTARIGAPPDLFSVKGQDWGLAPISPPALRARDLAPFREILSDVMAPAGAVRIDHAMALHRLYLIPEGETAETGAYVLMPMEGLLAVLAELSARHRTILVGEDLGMVPEGFREVMRAVELQSYRIAYFEKEDGRFRRPSAWPRAALACLSTHDLPALPGWWKGVEIERRRALGMIDAEKAAAERAERAADRAALVASLARMKLLPAEAADPDQPAASPAVLAAAHAFGARTRSRLFAVRLEDLAGDEDLVNLPGTDREHPNWRRKLEDAIETLFETERAAEILAAVVAERPR